MNIYLAWTLTVLYWIAFPIYWILYCIVIALIFILQPLLSVILFLLQPVIYLGTFIAFAIAWPFRLLGRFETLYIFLGVGGLVGLGCGLLIHYLYDYLSKTLRLNAGDKHQRSSIRNHDAIKRERREPRDSGPASKPPLNMIHEDSPPRGRTGLLAQTIYEEGDSDF